MTQLEINATVLHRVMGCGGYLGITPLEDSSNTITDERIEGNAAHEVFRLTLNGAVWAAEELIDRKVKDYIVTGDMIEHLAPHIEHIKARGLHVLTEEVLNWSTPDGAVIKCRADVVSYNQETQILYIDDPKYGWKIVEPKDNWQLIAYAIGAIVKMQVRPKLIMMTIHQPRPFHGDGPIRKWVVDYEHIMQLYHAIVERLKALPETVTTGPHCYKCDRASACPAARMSAMAAVDITTDAYHEDLTDVQVAYELDLLDRAQDALKVRMDALKSLAISKGGVPGWAMKQTYGNRKWLNGADVATLAMLSGVEVDKLATSALVSPAQAEKVGVPKEITTLWTERASRGFNLIRSDTDKDAKKLFTKTEN